MSDGSLIIQGYSPLEVRCRAVHAVLEQGLSVTDVAQAYGTDRSTIHRWLSRFDSEGDTGLLRQPGCGRPRIIGTLDSEALSKIILAPASKFGYETDFWTT